MILALLNWELSLLFFSLIYKVQSVEMFCYMKKCTAKEGTSANKCTFKYVKLESAKKVKLGIIILNML